MKSNKLFPLLRRPVLLNSPILPLIPVRHLSSTNTQSSSSSSSSSKRHKITPLNDDGHIPWSSLTAAEKAGRTFQQTINLSLVLLGLTLTSGVVYVLYTEVFSSDSKTAHFNIAVDRIKSDPRCVELLGDPKKIVAFGEETWNSWRRARPIASTVTKDRNGVEHLRIEFNVQGPRGLGRVNIHMTKRPGGHDEYHYQTFFVDVNGGHKRIWLENKAAVAAAAAKREQGKKGEGFKLFGVKWS
ncbi:putative mitochondrial import inner membrane translocase subunit tim-21 precursor [Cladorrhinum sp. PSN332]|nr:putative mitochondrial import inner membrane translocase subunit tim-21 precursor [Cladorrhinum sp. PSN332]